jgi:hypothetical protein
MTAVESRNVRTLTMQRDMKIGMSLGVALIGIVGALFFRREQGGDGKTHPNVPNVEQIDREIAEKAKTPYIQGIEQFDGPAAPVPPPGGPAKPNSGVRSDKIAGKDDTKPRETVAGRSGISDTLHTTKTDIVAIDTSPEHNRDWEPTGPSITGKSAGAASQSSPAGSVAGTGRTHVIRSGDTLSGLASRYLGSSARFREIYEANRDQLRSPDDVREGMTLKIPDAGEPRERQPVAATVDSDPSAARPPATKNPPRTKARNALRTKVDNATDDDGFLTGNERTTDAPRGRPLFEPVPRGPFSAGRVRQPEAN